MTRRFPRLAARRPDPGGTDPALDRATAARLLRTARSGRGWQRGTALEQLVEALPGHRHARRRLIEHVLHERRDPAAAERLLNEGLLLHPSDEGLARLRAVLLLMRGEPSAAEREIRLALARRPRHVGTLLLAARIAEARRARPDAVKLLERAVTERPRRDDLKRRLAETLLDAGAPGRARAVLATIGRPDPVLESRWLDADGRPAEALAHLEAAHAERPTDEEITTALIDTLERHGTPERLRALVRTVGPDQPQALARAGRAALLLGRFADVLARLGSLRRSGPHRAEALAISAVAASMTGRGGLARRLLEEVRRAPGGADPAFLADLWRRALTSRLHDGTAIARTLGVETDPGLLESLLHRTLEVLAEPAPPGAPPALAPVATARHRAACLAALGRAREADAVLRRAADETQPEPAPARPRTPVPAAPVRKAA